MSEDIGKWLDKHGLGKYIDVFKANEIYVVDLPLLTDDHLRELGLPMGPRMRVVAAIKTDALAPEEGTTKTQSPERPHTAAGVPPDAERRHLTVMFCDLVGSTQLSAQFDPEDLSDIVRAYQHCCAGIVSRFEGYVARYMGDGMLMYFGYPRAHEDDAERAIRAGLSVIESVGRLVPRPGLKLETRIGVASGLVVVGESVGDSASREQVVMGETPNLAARLQSLASPDCLVVSESTCNLVGDLFEYTHLGSHRLKGFDEPVQAHRVDRARTLESRYDAKRTSGLDPIVGRGHELALLLERWRQAKDGEGQMVLLSGEAGIGKSRIARAVVDHIADQSHFRISYQCSPYHTDSPLYPATQHLRAAAGLEPGDSADEQLDKLEGLLRQGSADPSQTAPLIASLLGLELDHRYGQIELDAQRQRVRTLEALLSQLKGLASKRPVLFVLEDAHWVDPSTLELIELSLEKIVTTPILILVTARPQFDYNFGGHPIVTRLTLNRLGRAQIRDIVDRVTGGSVLGEDLVDEIAVKTDGVPLFVEEVTKAALDSGSTSIPASLHDSLMARLDRVPEAREVAQIAAVIGRVFDHELLSQLAGRSDEFLHVALQKLIDVEVVFRRGKPPEATYAFRHALVRDAAYESLLKAKRRQLHERVAVILEAGSVRGLNSDVELLAHHYAEAELWEESVAKWLLAGNQSARRAANREAIGLIGRGLDLICKLPSEARVSRLELELVMTLAGCLRTLRGWAHQATVDAVHRARKLSDQLDGTPHGDVIGMGEYTIHLLRGELRETVALGQRLLDAAGVIGSNVHPCVGHRICGTGLFSLGRFEEARAHLEAAFSDYSADLERETIHHIGYYSVATFHAYLGHVLWHLGFPDQALQHVQLGIDEAVELRHVPTQAFACFQMVNHAGPMMRNDVEIAARGVSQYRQLVGDGDFLTFSTAIRTAEAWIRCERGDFDGALEEIDESIEWWKRSAGKLVVPWLLVLQARVQDRAHRSELASQSVDEASSWVEKFGEHWQLAEIYRWKGDLAARCGPSDSVGKDRYYRKALKIARGQSSAAFELRAATSLAGLLADQGNCDEARDLLASVYGRFGEGFQDPDLKAAESLLATLSPVPQNRV